VVAPIAVEAVVHAAGGIGALELAPARRGRMHRLARAAAIAAAQRRREVNRQQTLPPGLPRKVVGTVAEAQVQARVPEEVRAAVAIEVAATPCGSDSRRQPVLTNSE
jgi:hypothetical protein